MSEYQYYEFVAIDEPLSPKQVAELRARSSIYPKPMRCARTEPTSIGSWFSSWPGMGNVAPWFGASPMRVSGRSLSDDESEKDNEVHRKTPG